MACGVLNVMPLAVCHTTHEFHLQLVSLLLGAAARLSHRAPDRRTAGTGKEQW